MHKEFDSLYHRNSLRHAYCHPLFTIPRGGKKSDCSSAREHTMKRWCTNTRTMEIQDIKTMKSISKSMGLDLQTDVIQAWKEKYQRGWLQRRKQQDLCLKGKDGKYMGGVVLSEDESIELLKMERRKVDQKKDILKKQEKLYSMFFKCI